MTTLENLYYDNIRLTERLFHKGSKMDEFLKLLCRNEDDLEVMEELMLQSIKI